MLRPTNLRPISLSSLARLRQLHTLQYAVSFCAKGSIQNHNQRFGEDSAVAETWITPGKMQGFSLLAVADGVGGWRRHGVDSSFLSQGLTREMSRRFFQHETSESSKRPNCQSILTAAFTEIYKTGPIYAGGTTVCMGLFDPQTSGMQILNLGDSGAMVIRKNRIAYHTVADVDGMVPRQLTVLPKNMVAKDFKINLDPAVQTSTDLVDWQLEECDIVIFATDGFFDNVSHKEILSVVEEAELTTKTPINVQKISDSLLKRAYYNSLDPNYASPFALRCLQEGDYSYWGGKPDDISLVCCSVRSFNN